MKKTVILGLIISFLLPCFNSFAESETKPEENKTEINTETVSMNLEDAIKFALENSLVLKSDKSNIEAKKHAKINAIKEREKFIETQMDWTAFDRALIVKGYYVHAAENQYNASLRQYDIDKQNLINTIISDFCTYSNCIEKEKVAETNLENTEEKYSFNKQRYEQGLISKLDCELFEISVISAENELKKMQRETQLTLDKIKYTINLNPEYKLVINKEIPKMIIEYANPEEAIKLSRTQNNYLMIKENLDLSEEKWNYAKVYYNTKLDYERQNYYIEKYNFETIQNNTKKQINDLDMGIRNAYTQILNLEDTLTYTLRSLEYQKKDTEAAYTKYELGLITANQYIETEQKYFNSQIQYQDLLLSYRNAVLQYRLLYTTENGYTENKEQIK